MNNTDFKNDRLDDKLRWELLPMEEIEDIVKVFDYGAKKYKPNSWKNLDNGFERYRAALFRHMMLYIKGERFDKESGLMHLAQVAWNAIAMLWYDKHGKGLIRDGSFTEAEDTNKGGFEEGDEIYFAVKDDNHIYRGIFFDYSANNKSLIITKSIKDGTLHIHDCLWICKSDGTYYCAKEI